MKVLSLFPIGVVMLGISIFGRSRSTSTSPCRGPDSFSNAEVSHIKFLMHTTDDLYISFRQRVNLPSVNESAVQLVTDSATCSRALGTWNNIISAIDSNTPPLDSLYVISVGSSYDAVSPTGKGSEWNQHMVMDSLFHHVSNYLY